MGLDMYLSRKTYIKNYDYMEPHERHEVIVTKGGKPVVFENVGAIEEEIAYWRKANAIHQWFVDNVQNGNDNCASYSLEREQLQELVDTCKSILASPEQAKDDLPPTEGFFFGSTEIDDWYFDNLKYTVEVLEKELAREDSGATWYTYRASW